ncbi:unannotated protein [freshwater metagenome]|uniref:Unannotated protein n=1 Tax=freshwater metagenome TaxID=449393 RepID=A0A6J7QYJ1_9ZZZZ|nr:RDD family protein [Actinomycetota bacterium]MSW15430.1 RDD family protein [Actinomycetota bacterium]MSW99048.1 RDD family protein [Actinomycetota bacterium]MSY82622.1 RDD family protein [Actinomycetota bacterium]MSZ45899.1 RDD family protein [Actinomycetota bacterium]
MEKAGFGRRLGAIMADWVLAVGITNLFSQGLTMTTALLRHAVFFGVILLMTYLTQSSIGQRIFSIKVVDADTGGRLPPLRVLSRTLLLVLILPALFSHEGRGYHDILNRSAVIVFNRK